jgi:NCAIR mutase (PurE)-related protein
LALRTSVEGALKDHDFPVVQGRPNAFVSLLKAGTILLPFLEKSRLTRHTTTIINTECCIYRSGMAGWHRSCGA